MIFYMAIETNVCHRLTDDAIPVTKSATAGIGIVCHLNVLIVNIVCFSYLSDLIPALLILVP